MSARESVDMPPPSSGTEEPAPDALAPLLHERPARLGRAALPEVVLGELVAIDTDGATPLVLHEGRALRARTTVDLHGAHVGLPVVLAFEHGDPARPIVMGVLRAALQALDAPGKVEFDADGARMVVSAREQMVLRCGKASITLTRAGKVLIQGDYVSSRATGVNRVKGGSVQLN